MTFNEVKESIVNKTPPKSFLIFQYADSSFVPFQYVTEISAQTKLPINYLETLDNIGNSQVDLFGSAKDKDSIRVFNCAVFDSQNLSLREEENLFVITPKLSNKAESLFSEYVVKIPKLEDWCIKDYVYSLAEGIDTSELDWLLNICKYNINRLDSEISKIGLFEVEERKYLFDAMKYEGAFSDLSSKDVFSITNAIVAKDFDLLLQSLLEIKNIDAEPLGVVTILYQQFKKLIQVHFTSNPTPESTGLKSNVIYAIKKTPVHYTKEQLLKIFCFLASIDKELKSGKIDVKYLLDYTICKVLTL